MNASTIQLLMAFVIGIVADQLLSAILHPYLLRLAFRCFGARRMRVALKQEAEKIADEMENK